jgi:hypothetical protein
MKIEFSTWEYLKDHGKQPKGRGLWYFDFEGLQYAASGTLTEAKKKCVAHIREIAPKGYNKTVYVEVAP